jgi:hypothetical protein
VLLAFDVVGCERCRRRATAEPAAGNAVAGPPAPSSAAADVERDIRLLAEDGASTSLPSRRAATSAAAPSSATATTQADRARRVVGSEVATLLEPSLVAAVPSSGSSEPYDECDIVQATDWRTRFDVTCLCVKVRVGDRWRRVDQEY